MKSCSKCGCQKSLDLFPVDKRKPDGRRVECKTCVNARRKARYQADEVYRDKIKSKRAAFRATPEFHDWFNAREQREKRIERKRIERRKAGKAVQPYKSPRTRSHDSHVKAWFAERRKHQISESKRVEVEIALGLPYSHVYAYKAAERAARDRIEWHTRDKLKPETRANRIKRRQFNSDNLTDAYILRILTDSGKVSIPKAAIPLALMEAKREQLRIKRFINDQRSTDDEER